MAGPANASPAGSVSSPPRVWITSSLGRPWTGSRRCLSRRMIETGLPATRPNSSLTFSPRSGPSEVATLCANHDLDFTPTTGATLSEHTSWIDPSKKFRLPLSVRPYRNSGSPLGKRRCFDYHYRRGPIGTSSTTSNQGKVSITNIGASLSERSEFET